MLVQNSSVEQNHAPSMTKRISSSVCSFAQKVMKTALDCLTLIAYTAQCTPKFLKDGFKHGIYTYAKQESNLGVLEALNRIGWNCEGDISAIRAREINDVIHV